MAKGSKSHSRKSKKIEQVGCSGMMMGGGGAADHVISVVGGMGDQHANPGTNVLQQNAVGPEVGGSATVAGQSGGGLAALNPATIGGSSPIAQVGTGPASPVMLKVGGGKKKQLIAGLAVPTVLLYANKMGQNMRKSVTKKTGKMSKGMRGGKRMSKGRRTRRR